MQEHVHTIYTFIDGDMRWLKTLTSSSAGMYCLLNDGMIVYNGFIKPVFGNCYHYLTLDNLGNEVEKLVFGWEDTNENGDFDDSDTYNFDGDKCTMKEWFEKTKGYIYINENGAERLCNKADMIRYCEAK